MIDLTLYSRADCELCREMEETLANDLLKAGARLEKVMIDGNSELERLYGHEVPVLFVNGRKAFKFRVTVRELRQRLSRERKQ